MEIDQFVVNFAAQLEDTDPSTITASTKFREIDEWDSLAALSIIAMADDEYGVKVTGLEIKEAQTIEDIFNVVKSKL